MFEWSRQFSLLAVIIIVTTVFAVVGRQFTPKVRPDAPVEKSRPR